jgi:hypothetical protein
MVKVSSIKTKLKYSIGAKVSPRYFRVITEKSLIVVFYLPLLADFMDTDLDPYRDFCLDPIPKKRMRVRNTDF